MQVVRQKRVAHVSGTINQRNSQMSMQQANHIGELSAEELDAVAGGAKLDLNLGFAKLYVSITDHGVTGGVKVLDGKWKSGTIWFEDLPK